MAMTRKQARSLGARHADALLRELGEALRPPGVSYLDAVRDPGSSHYDPEVAARVIIADELPAAVLRAIVRRKEENDGTR